MRSKLAGLLLFCLASAAFAQDPVVLSTGTAPAAQDRSLWEVGLVAAGSYLPDYPASDESRAKWVGAPYFVYRGKIMRADRDGARASVLRTKMYELDLGVAASFASKSKDNDARRGMPDLDYLLELGPRVNLSLSDFGGRGKLRLFLPLRAVFSTDLGNFHHQGFTLTPSLNFRWRLGRRFLISQLTSNFGNRQISAYFYDVAPAFVRTDRSFYDARAGYMGSDLFVGVLHPLTSRTRLFTGAQLLSHTGSANESSPLFKRNLNYSVAAGIVWTFFHSKRAAFVIE